MLCTSDVTLSQVRCVLMLCHRKLCMLLVGGLQNNSIQLQPFIKNMHIIRPYIYGIE